MKVAMCLGVLFVLVVAFISPLAQAQRVEFNYNGQVKVGAQPYQGQGLFKFALVNVDGTISFWSNDGNPQAGTEPSVAVSDTVTEGFFSVNIGDNSIAGMAALDASMFNDRDRMYLRVWFNDGSHGFQRLTPDVAVVNPALLGGQSFSDINLYVNPAMGSNDYSGNTPDHPKKTIQAAWNVLPPMIRKNATIHLADGVYREEVNMVGKYIIGSATVFVIGNEANPNAVRVTGANAEADTTPVRTNGFLLENQKGVEIRGILFNYMAQSADGRNASILLKNGSNAAVKNCKFVMNYKGIGCWESILSVSDCEFSGGGKGVTGQYGVQAQIQSNLYVLRCNFHDLDTGCGVNHLTYGVIENSTINRCFIGCRFGYVSSAIIGEPRSTISNCDIGVQCVANAFTMGANAWVTNSGNGTNIQSQLGGSFYE